MVQFLHDGLRIDFYKVQPRGVVVPVGRIGRRHVVGPRHGGVVSPGRQPEVHFGLRGQGVVVHRQFAARHHGLIAAQGVVAHLHHEAQRQAVVGQVGRRCLGLQLGLGAAAILVIHYFLVEGRRRAVGMQPHHKVLQDRLLCRILVYSGLATRQSETGSHGRKDDKVVSFHNAALLCFFLRFHL